MSGTRSGADAPGSVRAFIVSMGLSAAGVTMSMLGATAIASATGGGKHGALWTGAFLITLFVAKAAAVRFVPAWSDRLGAERAFLITNAAAIALWAGAGAAVLLGAPGIVVILAIAPLAGVANAVFSIETPLLSKRFLAGHSMAGANARAGVARGIACAVGALAAGAVINAFGPGWTLVARGVLAVPFALVIGRLAPESPRAETAVPIDDPLERPESPRVLEDPEVRRIVALAMVLTVTTAPVVAMIVPIAQSLRQTPLVVGASIMLAAIATGELLAPFFVGRLERRHARGHDPLAGAFAATAVVLAAFGIASAVLSDRPELIAWILIGLAFGGLEAASHSAVLGELVAAAGSFDTRRVLATMKFGTNLAAPAGFLIWAVIIDVTDAQTAILIAAAVLMIAVVAIGRRQEHHAAVTA